MNQEAFGIVFLFVAFVGTVIYGSQGESFPVPIPKTVTYTAPFSIP